MVSNLTRFEIEAQRNSEMAHPMTNFLYHTRLQGIMVVIFIKIKKHLLQDDDHDSLRSHLIKETGHYPINLFDYDKYN